MGLGETKTPFLKGAHRLSRALGPRAKQSPWESGSNLTAVLGGHPGKTGVNVACCKGGDIENKALGNIQQPCLSLEVAT